MTETPSHPEDPSEGGPTGASEGTEGGAGNRGGGKGPRKGGRGPAGRAGAGRQAAYVVDAPLTTPSPSPGLVEVFRHRYLLRLLVRREIQARYSGSFLGLLWSYINPLSQFLIYYVVFGIIMGRNSVEAYAVHVFCGLVVVHFFTETFNAGTRSIVRNKALVRKMAVPKEMFPVASMLVSLYHVLPQVVILVVVCLFYGWTPDPLVPVALLLALAIVTCLATALAIVFSAANVFFRDFSSVVSILTNVVRFGVPMIYPFRDVASKLGDTLAAVYLWNPIADAVLLVQRAFWVGATPDPEASAATELPDHLWAYGGVMLVVSAVSLVLAQLIFRRLENKIPERLT
ncbi:ABC transporter permease [Nocardioides bruguierae]|uniref:Transport permease protein n=1 Tax=Nocardioides bruguierae TaxID=2945102 RepID=A0A9X2IF67_9ACTN|nr:ABC transporter permease [Nocardioides bruguierae]MCM0619390.1 ABC transporter permease [Nocardioides bruguierae]